MDTVESMTATELAAEAALVLSFASIDQKSGRVREAPSLRSIRYYTAHGLLDRPLRFHGRTALYGRRHLLQLVAIKRLQSTGLSLVEVQARLLGLDDTALEDIAALEARAHFWAAVPEEAKSAPPPEETMSAHRLDEGAVLLLEGVQRSLRPKDLEALRVAAAPMLKLLRARRILPRQGEEKDDE